MECTFFAVKHVDPTSFFFQHASQSTIYWVKIEPIFIPSPLTYLLLLYLPSPPLPLLPQFCIFSHATTCPTNKLPLLTLKMNLTHFQPLLYFFCKLYHQYHYCTRQQHINDLLLMKHTSHSFCKAILSIWMPVCYIIILNAFLSSLQKWTAMLLHAVIVKWRQVKPFYRYHVIDIPTGTLY